MRNLINLLARFKSFIAQCGAFAAQWSDFLIILPVTLLIFIFCGPVINLIDPTAAVLSVEALSILSFNLLCLFVIFGSSYFIWALYFGDLFKKGWENLINKTAAFTLSALLWLVTLAVAAFVLLRNL